MAFDAESLTLVGVTLPLVTLAGSAVAYIVKLFLDSAERRRNQFFELMQFMDSDKPIATKAAAVYELRRFPVHKNFIIRFCRGQIGNIAGPSAPLLEQEFRETLEFMERQ